MGAIASTLQLAAGYCFCNTFSSICTTCLGSRSSSSTGRKRSVLLLSIAILLSLFFQYSLAPSILHKNRWWDMYKAIPGMGKMMYSSWTEGCDRYGTLDGDKADLYEVCVQNAAVYRPMFAAAIFFICSAIMSSMNPSLNREIWPAKYAAYLITVFVCIFIPNSFFLGFNLTLMRLCAMVFILIQQVILIDMAYNWNESWVEKSNECESREWGSGKPWLRAIVASSVMLYLGSITGVILLYKYFSGCGGNEAVIALTWIGIVIMTVVQLTGEEGSLLTTAVISAYSTYIAYATVSKNPNAVCNPTLGNDDVWGIAVGMFLTLISLSWTGWSFTAQERLSEGGVETTRALTPNDPSRPDPSTLNLDTPFIDPEDRPTTGLVMNQSTDNFNEDTFNRSAGSTIWKLNVVLILICCWVSCSLTGWGSISGGVGEGGDHTAANPLVGKFNMAMIGFSQNLAVVLYLWTLLAPRLFPDRVFS